MEQVSHKRYRFLSGPDTAEFCQRVSNALEDGYKLFGNPVMLLEDGQRIVGQAVIWPEETIPEDKKQARK